MGEYMDLLGHPEANAIKSFEVETIKLKWASNVFNTDCGVFLMKHMELFDGTMVDCASLTGVCLFFVMFC